jgi:hypothetical protein
LFFLAMPIAFCLGRVCLGGQGNVNFSILSNLQFFKRFVETNLINQFILFV